MSIISGLAFAHTSISTVVNGYEICVKRYSCFLQIILWSKSFDKLIQKLNDRLIRELTIWNIILEDA